MFVRVRDFGTANLDLFPESSTGGQVFAKVTAAVAAIDGHLTKRVLARGEAQRVKATTRAAVLDYLKTIANTARRVMTTESGTNPFQMPARRSAASLIATSRAFIEEAGKREEQFVRLGLPKTFISDFRTLVDALDQAVSVRLNSRSLRHQAQAGIETSLLQGFEAIRDLDVIVANATRQDPVRFAAWRGARRIEGVSSRAKDDAPAAPETPPETVAPAEAPEAEVLGRAS